MKYNNKTRIDKSNENKTKIIECALKLINEKGFDNVSVSEITKEAGVSKGAFYIHFKSKEDLIEQEINIFYNEFKLDEQRSKKERLTNFLLESVRHIKKAGLKMCQEWFSHSVKGSFYGKAKYLYDQKAIKEIVEDDDLTATILSSYYGALNLWCFTDGLVDPEEIIKKYLDKIL